MVARDSLGRCIWWKRKRVFGRPSPTECEAMAVLFEVQESRARAWSRAQVETDCYPVYCYLMKDKRSLVSFGAILDSCFDLAYLFLSLSFSFVKRSGNILANELDFHCNEGVSLPPCLIQ